MFAAPYSRLARKGRRMATPLNILFAALCLLFAPASRAQSNPNSFVPAAVPPATNAAQMRFTVVDTDSGQPIPGVKVRAWVAANLTTDATGSCAFALPKPTTGDFSYRITITKDGYVSKYITWAKSRLDRVEDIPTNYTAKMDKAAAIGGILKTPDGQPVAGARIIFSGADSSGQLEREKTTVAPNFHTERTDVNGKWQCTILPQKFQDMLFRVDQPDYLPAVFGCEGSEEGGELVTRLPASNYLASDAAMIIQRGIELSGIILDKSGKPVPQATITRDHQWRNRGAILQSGEDGRFKISNLRPGNMVLTIQADTLEPQTVAIVITNQMPEVKVALNPGKILKGRVLDDAGHPVAGALIQMDREDFQPLEFDWRTTSDRDGRFTWDSAPAGPHPYLVTADGFNLRSISALSAENSENSVTLHKSVDKIMVDGQVTDLASHAAVENFTLLVRVSNGADTTNWTQEVNNVSGSYTVAIDPHATAFTIEFRAPGCLPFTTDPKSPGDGDQQMNIQLEKGTGRLLAGKLMIPNYAGQINWKAGQSIVLSADVPDPETPAFDSDEAKAIWMRQYMRSDEGKKWQREHRSFAITPAADGSFQCADVPAGAYQLRIQLQESPEQGGGPLASLTTNFTVTADAGAALALNLGTVAVPPPVNLKPGDTAPLFATKTVDGHSLKLADFKGRYVLLDFWATWCGPCVAEMPNLKAIYEKHAQDSRFAMISLSLDAQPAQPIDFARKNGIRWTQGFLGDGDTSPVPGLYGVTGIPAIFLISPDGKIIDVGLRGPEIESAITQALGAF
jgi:thiol-disulfide isomerase/thioredoxin